jgi:hypothetical protein
MFEYRLETMLKGKSPCFHEGLGKTAWCRCISAQIDGSRFVANTYRSLLRRWRYNDSRVVLLKSFVEPKKVSITSQYAEIVLAKVG